MDLNCRNMNRKFRELEFQSLKRSRLIFGNRGGPQQTLKSKQEPTRRWIPYSAK